MNRKKLFLAAGGLVTFFGIIGYFSYSHKIIGSKTVSVSLPINEENNGNLVSDDVNNAELNQEETFKNANPATKQENEESGNKQENGAKEEIKETSGNLSVINRYVSWGYSVPEKKRSIDTIIIHSSYDAIGTDPYGLSGLINEYRSYEVSPHYLIDRKGNIYRLVEEKNIAYHAGVSEVPDGRTDVNNFSIGIELMNKKDAKFTEAQYDSLNDLLRYLSSKYKIKYTLGHNQIAPGRKTDPWNFDWKLIK